jgi:DNA-directed RNA polymerase specialized sigma subunit|tara:strand:+ start:1078 stop:1833 length:756 start_codon:yes stop_codon:yes gene_type:complete
MTDNPVKPKRKRRKRTKRLYFTEVHENAILEYCSTADRKKREELYRELIQPAMNEMVDKIVYTYKFTTLPNIDELRDECKIWLTTILEKFDPSKGSKAFSYFSVITKNWFIHKVKKHSKQRQREIQYGDVPRTIEERYLSTENPYENRLEKKQFWEALWSEIEKWGEMPMKPTEERVYKAVKILMEQPDDIEIFNKKAIYLYLRELTGLNTKQVVNNLNKLRIKYRSFKTDWDEGRVTHIEKKRNEEKTES